jgi:hypothetical protein
MKWQPIETAPKDGTRIILGYDKPLFTGINTVFGRWEIDSYARYPKPYWTNDLVRSIGMLGIRENQPQWWMTQPKI